jgi:hypothetical protein
VKRSITLIFSSGGFRSSPLNLSCVENQPRFPLKSRRFDHEGIAFPVSPGVAHPLMDIPMRASVQRTDANVVDHLGVNYDMIVSLNDLVVIIVGVGQHRRSAVNRRDAPLKSSQVLRAVEIMKSVQLSIGSTFFWASGVRVESFRPRVRDDGITLICHNPFGVLLKGGIVVPYFIWPLDRLPICGLRSRSRTLFKVLSLVVC